MTDYYQIPPQELGAGARIPLRVMENSEAVFTELAEEMIRAAQTRVPGALGGRTHRAVAFELRVHYCAFRLGVLRSHSVTAEIGSLRPDAADYDSNAVWFEHPFRSAPAILKALFKG